MSGGPAHLLTTLFMAAAALGYPSRRSATDLDATPRTTVTFDGKGVRVLVMAVRFGILLAPALVHCDCIYLCQLPGAGRMATWGPLIPWAPEIQGCLVLGAPKKQAWQNHLPKSQREIRMYREPAMTNPWPCPAALGECPELGITPGLGSHGPNS